MQLFIEIVMNFWSLDCVVSVNLHTKLGSITKEKLLYASNFKSVMENKLQCKYYIWAFVLPMSLRVNIASKTTCCSVCFFNPSQVYFWCSHLLHELSKSTISEFLDWNDAIYNTSEEGAIGKIMSLDNKLVLSSLKFSQQRQTSDFDFAGLYYTYF